MRLYHGSLYHIKNPNISRGRQNTDFGKGFYTTTNFEQAKRWALNKQRVGGDNFTAIVNVYEIDDNVLENKMYRVLKFDSPNEQWLLFVVDCRKGKEHEYDMVFGAVANDRIYATITLFESNVLSVSETVARLRVNDIFSQISFHTDAVLGELSFVESLDVTNHF